MARPISILLPGLDGTGELFKSFVIASPPAWPVRVLPLPADRPRGYEDLADFLVPQLPSEPFAVIGESFSGPLAILLANRCPHIYAVVLCASFVTSPVPRSLARIPRFLWPTPPPAAALRFFMAKGDHDLARALRAAMRTVESDVLMTRIAAVLSLDASQDLEHLRQPLLCLRAVHDRLVPARCTTRIRALKPSAEIASIDGPHLLFQTSPTECWNEIAPFLERSLSTRAD